MKEYHITIRTGPRFFLAAVGGALMVAIIMAAGLYALVALDPLGKIKIRVRLDEQHVKARLAGSFPVVTEIDQTIPVPIKDTISVRLPFSQRLTIPLEKTLTVPVTMNTAIPVSLNVPFKADIPIDTEIFLDTQINTTVLGIPLTVPIKGRIPVRTTIPVSQEVKVREVFPLELHTPVTVVIKDTFQVPVDTVIAADVPLNTKIDLPFKGRIHANVSLEGASGTTEQIPNLYILDNTLEVQIEQLRLTGGNSSPPAREK